MIEVKIKDLKKGDFFTLKPISEPDEKQVYIRDVYARDTKKYLVYKFSDINSFRELKGDKIVYTDFIF